MRVFPLTNIERTLRSSEVCAIFFWHMQSWVVPRVQTRPNHGVSFLSSEPQLRSTNCLHGIVYRIVFMRRICE